MNYNDNHADHAHCVVTISTSELRIVYAGIYSSAAGQLSSASRDEFHLDVTYVGAETYAKARNRLIEILRHPSYRWVYDLLPENDRR